MWRIRLPALRRQLYNVVAATSLVLCHAMCVLWVRSGDVSDKLIWRRHDGTRTVESTNGDIVVHFWLSEGPKMPVNSSRLRYERREAYPWMNIEIFLYPDVNDEVVRWKWGGFLWSQTRNTRRGTFLAKGVIPIWPIALATAVPPIAWTVRWRRSRTRRASADPFRLPPAT